MRALIPAMVLAMASPVWADDATPPQANGYLSAAKRLYADLEYEKALEQLDRARSVPGTTPAELAEIEKYTGLVKFELGAPGAQVSFRTALALDPNAEIPSTVSPKIKAEWASLKAEMLAATQAREKEQVKPAPPSPLVVAPPVVGPPVEVPPATPKVAAVAPEPKVIDLQPVAHPDSTQVTQHPSEPERSMVSTIGPFVLVGAGAVLGGVGGGMGLASQSQTNQAKSNPIQLAAQSQSQSASQDALVANVLYAAAGAAVVAGVIWYFAR